MGNLKIYTKLVFVSKIVHKSPGIEFRAKSLENYILCPDMIISNILFFTFRTKLQKFNSFLFSSRFESSLIFMPCIRKRSLCLKSQEKSSSFFYHFFHKKYTNFQKESLLFSSNMWKMWFLLTLLSLVLFFHQEIDTHSTHFFDLQRGWLCYPYKSFATQELRFGGQKKKKNFFFNVLTN